jgi:hypothetical protein
MLPHSDPIDESLPPDLYPIRLQGPWQFAWIPHPEGSQNPGGSSSLLSGTIRLPASSEELIRCRSGTLRLARNFQQPTNLDPEERVLLLLPPGCRPSRARLNEQPMTLSHQIGTRVASDLTALLRPSNELVLEFDVTTDDPPPVTDLSRPILLGIMPDYDGSWWESLPRANC